MSKNLFEDAKALIAESIFLEDKKILFDTYYHFFSRFLDSEEEFKKTHSKESLKNLKCYRTIVKNLFKIEDFLIEEYSKND